MALRHPTAPPAAPPRRRRPPLRAVVRALRPHQWAKNGLLFLAPLGAHALGQAGVLATTALAAVAFSLVASALYVANDLHDLEADRRHPTKRRRPFASGDLPTWSGWVLVPALLAAGALATWPLPAGFRWLLAGYAAITSAYSAWLKRLVVADVLTLAGLYTIRIYGGALATGIPVSDWLASFSMFLFVSLALMKRATELARTEAGGSRRGYGADDLGTVVSMGSAAGFVAVLVLALYLNGPEVRRLYATPAWLWALCVLMLYWIARLWLVTSRGEMDDDPVVYALRDRASWVVGLLSAAVLWLGARGWP